MANKVLTNKKWTLQLRDFAKGAIIAIGTPVLYLLQELIPGYDLDPIAKAAISALITYLIKNFFAPASVTTTYDTNTKAATVAEDIKSDAKV